MAKLTLFTKSFFGVGQVAEGVKNTAFNLFLLFFYNQVLGLPGSTAGFALFIATAFDAVTDPLAGSISDRFQHRWGRRHPFMYASAVPLGVTFALLFRPPDGLDETGLFLWLVIFAIGVRTSMTLYHVPHAALGAELSKDYHERTTVVAFRTVFGLIGAALVVTVARAQVFVSTPEFANGQLNPAGYPGFGLLFGGVITLSILISAAGTHSRIPYLPQPSPDLEPLSRKQIVRDYRHALSNVSFRALFLGMVVFFVMRGIQEVLGIYMATYFWRLDANQITAWFISPLPGLILGIPFWTWATRRIDKKPTFIVGVAIFSVSVLAPPIAKILGAYPESAHPAYMGILLVSACIGGFGAVAGMVTASSMMADITDEHELRTGFRQEGIFFGAFSFAIKASSGLGTFFAGVGLDVISFPTQADPASVAPEILTSLGILYGPGIAALAVVSLVILNRYNIDRARHIEIAEALDRRAAETG